MHTARTRQSGGVKWVAVVAVLGLCGAAICAHTYLKCEAHQGAFLVQVVVKKVVAVLSL